MPLRELVSGNEPTVPAVDVTKLGPGATGAWTGTLAASLLDMDFKKSVLACMGGVLLAGIIMGALSLLGVSVFGG